MAGAVNALAASAFFLNNSAHASRAALLLRTWFVDADTRMRPSARFAQVIPGVGHGQGLIDFSDGADPGGGGNYDTSISLAHLLDSVRLLEWAAPAAWAAPDRAALDAWVREWHGWILTDSAAQASAAAKNNIGDWYDSLAASAAYFVGNQSTVQAVCDAAPARRIAEQVTADGSLPAEDARTKSESYHAFAMVALLDLAWLCRTAAPTAPDLFEYETADGRSLRGVVEWMLPLASGRLPWTAGAQVRPFDPTVFSKVYRTAALGWPHSRRRFGAVAARQPGARASRQNLLRPFPTGVR